MNEKPPLEPDNAHNGYGAPEFSRVGFGAWVILFLSVFLGMYGGMEIGLELCLGGRYGEFVGRVSVIGMILGMFAGWPAISYYRMRSLLPIRCLAFLASASAIVLAASPLYRDYDNHPLVQSLFGKGMLIAIGLLLSVVFAECSAMRVRYLYSTKTDRWLQCHTSKSRLVPEPGKAKFETIAEILTLDAAKRTWRDTRLGVPELALFLDSEPEGDDYLWCAVRTKRQSFFSLKLSQPKYAPVLVPLDWEQVGLLRARFGEFRKTFFIPLVSAVAGDCLRKRMRRQESFSSVP